MVFFATQSRPGPRGHLKNDQRRPTVSATPIGVTSIFGRQGEPMTTARASAEASPAENGEHPTTVRKVPADAAPTVHAVPVEHTEKPGKPVNVKSLPVRPGE